MFQTCADDVHVVYIDGKQVNSNPATNEANQVINTTVPANAQVIAIAVTNIANTGGLRAGFADGSVVSDGSWKCSTVLVDGWEQIGFDDSLWPAPTTTSPYPVPSDTCSGFTASSASAAKLLWTDKNYNLIGTIYCRKTLSKKISLLLLLFTINSIIGYIYCQKMLSESNVYYRRRQVR